MFENLEESFSLKAGKMGSGYVMDLRVNYQGFKDLLITENAVDESSATQARAASMTASSVAKGQKINSISVQEYMENNVQGKTGNTLTRNNAQLGIYNATLSTNQTVGSSLISSMNSMVSTTQSTVGTILGNLTTYLQNFNSLVNVISSYQL